MFNIENNKRSLVCAHCHESYTHVRGIVWFRRSEDALECNTAFVDSSECFERITDGKQNPSKRRDGMHIVYDCETCKEFSSLSLAQHKGYTEIDCVKCHDDLLSKAFKACL